MLCRLSLFTAIAPVPHVSMVITIRWGSMLRGPVSRITTCDTLNSSALEIYPTIGIMLYYSTVHLSVKVLSFYPKLGRGTVSLTLQLRYHLCHLCRPMRI
ncbi:hypothetical protein BDV10DRAFT_177151 [Aspergillus recurvatus]